ncbi:MAG: hypothetical protein ACLFRI_06920 [Candidatus Izemoplasmataceae bacterium]
MNHGNGSMERARLEAHMNTERYAANQLKQNQSKSKDQLDQIKGPMKSIKYIVSRLLAIIISLGLFILFITWLF